MIFCIDATSGKIDETINPVALTKGKFYKALDQPSDDNSIATLSSFLLIEIINDEGKKAYYRKERFVTLTEWRQLQLEKLLNGIK